VSQPRRLTAVLGAVAAASAGMLLLASCSATPASEVGPTTTPTVAPLPAASGSAGPAAPDARLASFYSQQLVWRPCDGDFQCTSLSVPLSYDDPAAASISLQVIRLKAADQSRRIGSLVMNPGGPGGSGIDYARAARAVTTDALRERYDVVGFDPRGVGTSNPIRCLDDKQTDEFLTNDGAPSTPAEVAMVAEISAGIAKGCLQRSPQLVAHIGTRDVAKDLDILRQALGDQKLTYLGKSYGTAIGSSYAEQFPQNVGRMVLDGAIDPALDYNQIARGQAEGFELALRRFVEKCPSLDACPLPADPKAAVARIQAFLAELDAKPLPGEPGRPLTQALGLLGIVGSLYDNDSGWPDLASSLDLAFKGDGSGLLSAADYFNNRNSNGHFESNSLDALNAVNCWDLPATPGIAGIEQQVKEWSATAPTFGPYIAWSNLPCSTWPAHSSVLPHPIKAAGAPPIVVIGTTYDPATPVHMAKALAGELDKGVFLQWDGDGHTAYQRGSDCIDKAVDTYYLDGTPPKDGTLCR
jgi:pimeloyl-ACP methyl ester carboxylesterase